MRQLLLIVLLLGALPAQAALIQDIYLQRGGGEGGEGEEGGEGGTPTVEHIGTMEFTTESSGAAGAAVVQANISLGGVDFTLANLRSASWSIDSNWELVSFQFIWASPGFGGLPGGYEFTLTQDEFNPSGVTASLISSSFGCDLVEACLNESIAVSGDLSTLVRQGIPAFVPRHEEEVPAPATLLLMGLGLLGGIYRRRVR